MKNFAKNLAGLGALACLGLLFAGPAAVALGVGVSIFMAPQVAAMGWLAQTGLAVAGGFGAGLATRVVSVFTLIPLGAVLTVAAGREVKSGKARSPRRSAANAKPSVLVSAKAAPAFGKAADVAAGGTKPQALSASKSDKQGPSA
jgi:hypothetical protein